jgi:predicted dithiol-disulfide oxidoreductase (DUF899 family)
LSQKSEWLRASSEFLAKEKELTRLSDELSRQRRELPWTRVEKPYVFEGPKGKMSLADLFDGRSQLATYHFMLGPDSVEGCSGCSHLADNLDGTLVHLHAKDVSLVFVSRGPLEKIVAFKKRMGWHFPWVSSGLCDFNHDFGVSFSKEELASGAKTYNLNTRTPYSEENPGMSFFYKDASVLDRAPKGRDEDTLPGAMGWVRHHDKYPQTVQIGG